MLLCSKQYPQNQQKVQKNFRGKPQKKRTGVLIQGENIQGDTYSKKISGQAPKQNNGGPRSGGIHLLGGGCNNRGATLTKLCARAQIRGDTQPPPPHTQQYTENQNTTTTAYKYPTITIHKPYTTPNHSITIIYTNLHITSLPPNITTNTNSLHISHTINTFYTTTQPPSPIKPNTYPIQTFTLTTTHLYTTSIHPLSSLLFSGVGSTNDLIQYNIPIKKLPYR